MYRNVAGQIVAVYAWNTAAGAPQTGDSANITAQISLDAGACAATADTNPSQLDAVDAPGVYLFGLSQAETDAAFIVIQAVSSTANVHIDPLFIYTDLVTPATLATLAASIVNEWETQSQADPTGFHVNVMEVNGTPQTANDNGADINAILTDTNELQTDLTNGGRLDLLIDDILADTNELQADDTPAALAAIDGKIDTIDGIVDTILVDTNELQTDDIPGSLATIEGKIDTIDGIVDNILVDTNELQTDDIPGSLTAIDGKIDTIDGIVDSILVDTDELQADDIPGSLATIEGKIDTIDGIVDDILLDTDELQTDDVPGLIAALNNISVSDITGVEVDNDGTAISLAGALKLCLSVLTGKSSGGGTATIVFRDIADSKNRISATVDINGNRTAIGTRDAS